MIVYNKGGGNDKLLENEIENNSEIKYATARNARDDYEGKIAYNGDGGMVVWGQWRKCLWMAVFHPLMRHRLY